MNLLTQIKHKTQKGEEVIMDIGAKASNVLPENFVEQKERSNLAAKDKLPVIFGKLSKWYADLRPVAWSGSYSDLTNKPTIPEGSAANYQVANNDTTEAEGFVADARIVRTHGLEIDGLSRDLKVVKEHSVWEQIGSLSGTAQKIFDFSQCEEICLVTTCAGNAKLVYTVKIPVVVLSEDKIHVCNGGYTAGTGAQCEWEISKTSCRLLACYVGGTNYTGSATTIYAR